MACQLMISPRSGGQPPKSAKEATRRRKKQEAVAKEALDVEAACDTLLKSREFICKMPVMSKKLMQVATMVVKCMLKGSEDDTIELPTGGPVSTMTLFLLSLFPFFLGGG